MSTALPSASEVESVSGGKSHRFSEGRIVTGRDKDGTLKVIDAIVGRIVRVGIHEAVTRDEHKRPIMQVEADIETEDGLIYVKAGLLDQEEFRLRPSTSAIHFAWGLTLFSPEDIVQIKASQGVEWQDERGRERKPSTYVNWAKVVQEEGKWLAKPVYRPKPVKDAPKKSQVEKWQELEPQLRALPHFAPRPAGRDDDEEPTHFSELEKELKGFSWVTPTEAPTEWLQLVANYFGHSPKQALSQYDDDDWGKVRKDLLEGIKSGEIPGMPPALQAAADRLKGGTHTPRRNAFA